MCSFFFFLLYFCFLFRTFRSKKLLDVLITIDFQVQQYKHERECNAIIAETREDKISRLESLMDGIFSTEEFMHEEFVSLTNEHKVFHTIVFRCHLIIHIDYCLSCLIHTPAKLSIDLFIPAKPEPLHNIMPFKILLVPFSVPKLFYCTS